MIRTFTWYLLTAGTLLTGCQHQDHLAVDMPDVLQLEMVAKEFNWGIRYPGFDGELFTEDDFFSNGDIRLPQGVKAEISLKSEDYIYFVQVPALEKRSMAIPGLANTLTFQLENNGTIQLIANQSCGFKHETLNRQIIFTNRNHFIEWSLKKSKE